MSLKAVLFDLDDTLLDTSRSREERARRAHRRLLQAGYEVNWRGFWHSLNALDEGGFYRRGMPLVVRDMGLQGTPLGQECIDLWFFRGAEDLLTLFDGCLETLRALQRRYRLGVITNGPETMQSHKFRYLAIEKYFELFLSSGAAGVEKPDPRIFVHALSKLALAPHEAVFIGDHLDLDVIGAQQAGLRTIWFNPSREPSRYPEIVPDAAIGSHDELLAQLSRWDEVVNP